MKRRPLRSTLILTLVPYTTRFRSIAQSYNLSVSNGTEKGNYYFSLGYYNNDGLVKNTDFNRISARINSDFKLWDGIITIGENLTMNRTSEVVQPHQIVEAALIAVPFIPVRTEDGAGWGGPITGLPDRRNPANLVEENKDNRYTYWRIFGNQQLNGICSACDDIFGLKSGTLMLMLDGQFGTFTDTEIGRAHV